MSFSKTSFSELLVDLSEEQQEIVAGGATRQFEQTYVKEEYTEEHSQSSPETTGNAPVGFNSTLFWTPLLFGVNPLNINTPDALKNSLHLT